MIKKHVTLTPICIDIMDEMIQTEDVKNYSDAIRVALLERKEEKTQAEYVMLKRKIDEMSRHISVLVSMVAGGFAECHVADIPPLDECTIYHVAKGMVSQDIQRAITSKSGNKSKTLRPSIDG